MTCLAERLEFTTAGATESGGSVWKWVPLPRHTYRLDVVSYCWLIKESGTFFFGKQMLRASEIRGETQQDIPDVPPGYYTQVVLRMVPCSASCVHYFPLYCVGMS